MAVGRAGRRATGKTLKWHRLQSVIPCWIYPQISQISQIQQRKVRPSQSPFASRSFNLCNLRNLWLVSSKGCTD